MSTLGRYNIIAELGQGGMAEVFLAMIGGPTGSGFTKLAVVKRLRPNLVEDPEFVAMLVDEARISARLNHPNVVQTLEVGVEGEEYFIAMEFLDGQPLHRIQRRSVRTQTPFPQHLSLVVVADALAGLHHAHELADYDGSPLGIVHRDVTPQNIFVTYDGNVKVVDFGIAKAAGRASETKQGVVKGKVRYMSPEQAIGQHVDRRADIFAAGILLWEASTGMRFWSGQDDMMIYQRLIAGTYDASPRAMNPEVDAKLDAICTRAMAHRREDRYATAEEMLRDIEHFLSRDVVHARRQLGPAVAQLFANERAQVKQIIERAGRANTDALSVATLLASSSMPGFSNSSSTQVAITSIAPAAMSTPAPAAPSVSAPTAAGRRHRRTAVLAAAIPLIGGLSLLFFLGLRSGKLDLSSSGGNSTMHPRTPTSVEHNRLDLVLRSATRTADRPAGAGTFGLPPATVGAAQRTTEEVDLPSQPAVSAPPPAAQEIPDPARKRNKPVIDLGDPWPAGKPEESK